MTRVWMRELTGWLVAAAVALITAGVVASSARADLLFRDGDSLIVAMVARSLLAGERLDWAMSSVLFLPESATFAALDTVLPLGVNGLLAASSVLNLLALYGAIRVVAGRSRDGMAPVAWSVLALAVFGVLAMTDTSPSRDALDLTSLQLTTTYYSATVVAVVLSIGIVRRVLDRERGSLWLPVALGVVALISTLSNPLYAVWAAAPLTLLLAIGAVRSRHATRILVLTAALLAGTALGFVARIPFSEWIANTGAGYAQPSLWRESIGYYGSLLEERLQSPLGIVGALIAIALLSLGVVRSIRTTDAGSRSVAIIAWAMPLLVMVGAIALGTHAARYLQPIAFAPVLALVATPRVVRIPGSLRRRAAVVVGVVLLVGGGFSIPRLAVAAEQPDADLACVTDWITESGRTGAGQFWTVRLPKLHLDDPSQLVQVDHQLGGYAWLVNRTDFDAGEVSFLIEDSQTVPWDLPVSTIPERIVDCGRYSITDFGRATLPLGPQRS